MRISSRTAQTKKPQIALVIRGYVIESLKLRNQPPITSRKIRKSQNKESESSFLWS